jgi:hypothetical protein
MKKSGKKSANMYVMFALLTVLFVSLGYLLMQSREGLEMPDGPKKAAALKEGMKKGFLIDDVSVFRYRRRCPLQL